MYQVSNEAAAVAQLAALLSPVNPKGAIEQAFELLQAAAQCVDQRRNPRDPSEVKCG